MKKTSNVRSVIHSFPAATLLATALLASSSLHAQNDAVAEATRALSSEIINNGTAYENLRELTSLGHRLSGTANAERGVQWAKSKLESYGFDHVTLQPVQVPHWVRGDHEVASVVSHSQSTSLTLAALGGSAGTAGITAGVIEVKSLNEVTQLGEAVRGKIIFYNRPMDSTLANTFEAYSGAIDQRSAGPRVAAAKGAVAVLVRSLTTLDNNDYPHTGMTNFGGGSRIPAAALSTKSANQLSAILTNDPAAQVHLELSAEVLAPVTSYNVYGEYPGTTLPNEYVVVGGHLDSWDLGQGAHDDGAGVVQAIEVVRAMKALNLRPKRTVRVVLFMSEENGASGANEYARQASLNHEKHIAALESDEGGFAPKGFSGMFDGMQDKLELWKTYLSVIGPMHLKSGEAGTDVNPLGSLGAICFGLNPDSTHYFDYHHSAMDRFEAVNKVDLNRSAAAMGIMIHLFANEY
jgi:carboxypeptidase Q